MQTRSFSQKNNQSSNLVLLVQLQEPKAPHPHGQKSMYSFSLGRISRNGGRPWTKHPAHSWAAISSQGSFRLCNSLCESDSCITSNTRIGNLSILVRHYDSVKKRPHPDGVLTIVSDFSAQYFIKKYSPGGMSAQSFIMSRLKDNLNLRTA